MSDLNDPEYWQNIYREGKARWDLAGPTPVFERLAATADYPAGKMIVLGAGRGHDARMFAKHGFQVTAIDFAPEAIRAMYALAQPGARHGIIQADMFELPDLLHEQFDYVLEYVFFCAIDPSRRAEYADVVARLLRTGGRYIALAFPLGDHEGGPPFAVDTDELVGLLAARGFVLERREWPADSVPGRAGREELVVMRKVGGGSPTP